MVFSAVKYELCAFAAWYTISLARINRWLGIMVVSKLESGLAYLFELESFWGRLLCQCILWPLKQPILFRASDYSAVSTACIAVSKRGVSCQSDVISPSLTCQALLPVRIVPPPSHPCRAPHPLASAIYLRLSGTLDFWFPSDLLNRTVKFLYQLFPRLPCLIRLPKGLRILSPCGRTFQAKGLCPLCQHFLGASWLLCHLLPLRSNPVGH